MPRLIVPAPVTLISAPQSCAKAELFVKLRTAVALAGDAVAVSVVTPVTAPAALTVKLLLYIRFEPLSVRCELPCVVSPVQIGIVPAEPLPDMPETPPPLTVSHESTPEPLVASTWPLVPSVKGSVQITELVTAPALKPTYLSELGNAPDVFHGA